MVFRFLILSDEVDDFKREIQIDASATFLDLHDAILDAVGFAKDEMSSFFLCEDDWTKKTEITRVEMDTSSDQDNYTMEDTVLEDMIEDEGQRLLFVFDYLADRAFFMDLKEIITGKTLSEPLCSKSVGKPPKQSMPIEEIDKKTTENNTAVGEEFFGDSEFEDDELDKDGFSGLDDEGPVENPFDDERY